jgi:cell division protein FtsB
MLILMLEKLKVVERFKSLSDMRVAGLVLVGILTLLVSWSAIGVIETNYDLQKEISKLQQENAVEGLRNENLKLENKYLETDTFLELAARRQFGKAAPGEKVLIVPKQVALANTIDVPEEKKPEPQVEKEKPWYQRNLDAWFDFLLHRQD